MPIDYSKWDDLEEDDDVWKPHHLYPPGVLCVLEGLSKDELNGRVAEVRGQDKASGRIQVRLDPDDRKKEWKAIKPENLRPLNASAPEVPETGSDRAVAQLTEASSGVGHLG